MEIKYHSKPFLLNIHLLRKEYSKNVQVVKAVPIPTTSLRNLLVKSQPNVTSPSSFAKNLRKQCALDTETTFWSDHLYNIFSSSFCSSISLNSHIFMLKCIFCYLQDRTGDSHSSSECSGLTWQTSFPDFYSCWVQNWYQLPSSLLPDQGNCNIYFQCAVCFFTLQVSLLPLIAFSFCLCSG